MFIELSQTRRIGHIITTMLPTTSGRHIRMHCGKTPPHQNRTVTVGPTYMPRPSYYSTGQLAQLGHTQLRDGAVLICINIWIITENVKHAHKLYNLQLNFTHTATNIRG